MSLQETAAAAASKLSNPAERAEVSKAERKRVPMSVPQQKLRAPRIEGYYCYWMRGTPDRLAQAMEAGYEFVLDREVSLQYVPLGGDAQASGNTDMGTRVSQIAGSDVGEDGQPIRLYLMKQKMEWHEEDLKLVTQQTMHTVDALNAGRQGAEKDSAVDAGMRYVGKQTKLPDMFTRKR